MHLGKLIHTKTGKYILSIILGFGLASLFKRMCKDNDERCISYQSPSIQNIEQDVHHFNDACYNYKAKNVTCNSNSNSNSRNNNIKIVKIQI